MGKNISLEIATPMTAVEPDAISDVISEVDFKLVRKLGLRGGWVTDHETQKAHKSSQRIVKPVDEHRYIHYARASEKTNMTSAPFDILNFVIAEDPKFRAPNQIGEVDLPSRIRKSMKETLGRCSLEGMVHRFDEVEIVDPIKDKKDKHKVVILRQLSFITDEASVQALDLITNLVKERLDFVYPELDKIGHDDEARDESLVTVERSIPIASVYLHDSAKHDFDPEVLDYIRQGIKAHIITPTCDFISSDLDISHES